MNVMSWLLQVLTQVQVLSIVVVEGVAGLLLDQARSGGQAS